MTPLETERTDKLVQRRLLLAKAIHQRGDDLGSTGSDLDGMLAIHHVHLAVEIVLRAIASQLRLSTQARDPGFEELLKLIVSELNSQAGSPHLPLVDELRSLNKTRNLVQHNDQSTHA